MVDKTNFPYVGNSMPGSDVWLFKGNMFPCIFQNRVHISQVTDSCFLLVEGVPAEIFKAH